MNKADILDLIEKFSNYPVTVLKTLPISESFNRPGLMVILENEVYLSHHTDSLSPQLFKEYIKFDDIVSARIPECNTKNLEIKTTSGGTYIIIKLMDTHI